MSLTSSYKIEEEILLRFPTEKLQYYRTSKRGKIYMKYCNMKCSRNSLKRKAEPQEFSEDVTKSNLNTLCVESNAEDCVRSLRYDKLSADEFDGAWQSCSNFRINEINKSPSLDEIFKAWPEYKKPSGFRYIDKDFGVAFGKRHGVLSNWTENFTKIKNFLLSENNVKDKALVEMLQNMDESQSNDDNAAAKLMWCIHGYLIPTIKVTKNESKKTFIKYTIRNSQDAFMFVGNSVQEINDFVQKLATQKGFVQPFILARGDKNFCAFDEFFVYLDGISFQFNSFLRTLDMYMFQIFSFVQSGIPPSLHSILAVYCIILLWFPKYKKTLFKSFFDDGTIKS